MRRSPLTIVFICILLCSTYTMPLFAGEICSPDTLIHTKQHIEQQGWKEYFKDDEITVYNRTTPDSEIREVLATAKFPIHSKAIFNTLSDYPQYIEFMPYVEESNIIKQKENSTILFQQLSFPWPISDRYFFIELTSITGNNESYNISWRLASETNSSQLGKGIALKTDNGYWKLCPIGTDNSTYIEYFIHTDPGGALPVWIINQANSQAVPDVLRALYKRVMETTNNSNQ
ncbi:MAG: hypothetical protein DIZ78_01865 [endosymbiont of Escarpia spicata]|uniref:Coenzyme Q-binding protein COQ10 START domain-containing protein n=1 Tax=endosymbiont of Escarpia spicata TaxID=2200908 RepID=A0A370DSN7_9GAMM|nr:MAG: hypothetical protein DIZ78_01865 [endosymbiont of Escarpia spicata]